MAKWKKETLKLKDNHGWRAKPGCRIFVADQGAVRFNFPQDWIVVPDADSINFYDRQPPEDNCRLALSYMRLPEVDWSGLPLSQLIQAIVDGDPRDIVSEGKITEVQRPDLELAWTEIRFMDPNERREAISRICLGRGSNIQSLITLDYWAEDSPRLCPVWDEVIRSLELGRYIRDPTVGEMGH